jgi:N-acetylglutamate synthase-like GNAT family acetyltransferase
MNIRRAEIHEAPALARLINDAFVVEAFFKTGDRTNAGEIRDLMESGGEFLVIEDAAPETAAARLCGCVYLTRSGERAYFGMLSIDPPRQHRGLGPILISAAETRARDLGCRFMDIHIVNLREELPPYYRRFGYHENGTLPFSDPDQSTRPCFFIVMSKLL